MTVRPAPLQPLVFASVVFSFLGLAAPDRAHACACCDGGDDAEVLGFTDTDAALVERHGMQSCQALDRLEVWRAESTAPVRCFDLQGADPNRGRRCEDWAYADNFDRPAATGHPRLRVFPRAPRYVSPDDIRATLTRYDATATAPGAAGSGDADEEDDEVSFTHTLIVEVRTATGFQRVASMDLSVGAPERFDDEEEDEEEEPTDEDLAPWLPPPDAIEVRVAVSPGGANLVVLVKGFDAAPGMGHFPTEVRPGVARGLDGARLLTTVPAAALAVASPDAAPQVDEAHAPGTVARFNRLALTAHRARDYASAARGWAGLLAAAPDDANVRYNLACALARLDQPERALDLLRDLQRQAGAGCTRCRERLTRARRDPDLASVRALPGFRELNQAARGAR
ncbi:MAG: hypothetical protein H6726_28695 [Sandaracinaceae bacterium]|nr:hypothetical protein [Myxococcales bacterium]MCB9661659.1 hypothetical protein [Sandaracinaceae bacterium]